MFAKYASTRTVAMLQCEVYGRLDRAHGGALTALSEPESEDALMRGGGASGSADLGPVSPAAAHADGDVATPSGDRGVASPAAATLDQPPPSAGPSPDQVPDTPDTDPTADFLADADPRDEVMTAYGTDMVLLFGLFVDGVQLHQHGRSTTTVFCLKCLELPGFLANTDLATYTLTFVEGPKEPTCMTTLLMAILRQFKIFEPTGVETADGALYITVHANTLRCSRVGSYNIGPGQIEQISFSLSNIYN